MMTPEQIQRTIEFILSSHADSAVRMDRLEEGLGRVQDKLSLVAEDHQRLTVSLREQRENLDVLLSVTQDLVRVSKIHNERIKRLEAKPKNK